MPDNEKWNEWRASLIQLRDGVKDNIEIGSNFFSIQIYSQVGCFTYEHCFFN